MLYALCATLCLSMRIIIAFVCVCVCVQDVFVYAVLAITCVFFVCCML